MSDKIYSYHDDEGYADDSYHLVRVDTDPIQYQEDTSNYFTGDDDSKYIPRFTEEEMLTVIGGTRAECRIMIKETRKRNEEGLNHLQGQLELTLEEEKMVLEEKIHEQRQMLEDLEVNKQDSLDEGEDKMSCDFEFENACLQMEERKQELEELKTFKEITDVAYMDIKQQTEDLDNKVAKLCDMRTQSFDDFSDTNITFKKTVRKCREQKDTLYNAIEYIEKLFKQFSGNKNSLQEKEIMYTELQIKMEADMEHNNNKYEEIKKTHKQELAITNAQLKRKNMELQELDVKIALAENEKTELQNIADELMTRMDHQM